MLPATATQSNTWFSPSPRAQRVENITKNLGLACKEFTQKAPQDTTRETTTYAIQQANLALNVLTPHIEALSHNEEWLGQLEKISLDLLALTDLKADGGKEKCKELGDAIIKLANDIKENDTESTHYIKDCLTLCTILLLIFVAPIGLVSLCFNMYCLVDQQEMIKQTPDQLKHLRHSIDVIFATLQIDPEKDGGSFDVGYSDTEKDYLKAQGYDALTFPDDATYIKVWLKVAGFGPGLRYRDKLLAQSEFVQKLSEVAREYIKYDYSKMTFGGKLHTVFFGDKLQSPKESLKTGHGICGDYAIFFADTFRFMGFGTRIVGGFTENNSSGGHWWTEIYLPKSGWIPIENVQKYTVDKEIIMDLTRANGWTPNGIIINDPFPCSFTNLYESRPYLFPLIEKEAR